MTGEQNAATKNKFPVGNLVRNVHQSAGVMDFHRTLVSPPIQVPSSPCLHASSGQTKLQYLMKESQRLVATRIPNGKDPPNPAEVCLLMMRAEMIPEDIVRVIFWRVGDQVWDSRWHFW